MVFVRRPYIIFVPYFGGASAGIRVLRLLAEHLSAAGEVAHAFTPKMRDGEHIFYDQPKFSDLVDAGAIVVYPEGDSGNICDAEVVVRYVLNTPRYRDGRTDYDPDELVFSYNDLIAPRIAPGRCLGVLTVPSIETELFHAPTDGLERVLTSFYVGKGCYQPGYVDPMNYHTVEITHYPPYPFTRPELAQLLRRSKVLYCFDMFTGMIHEAALCGCPVVLVQAPDSPWTLEQISQGALGMGGVTVDNTPSGIALAASQCYLTAKRYALLRSGYAAQLQDFIRITQAARPL